LPTIVDLNRVGAAAWIELTAIMLVVLVAVDVAWALLAVRARRLLTNVKAVKVANRTSSAMMAGAAVVIAAH
jgi:threonine/homoserine/homoserine lactone efflux protein